MIQSFGVTGMTCQNCVRHVTQALSGLPGVRSVQIDLESGVARLDTEREISRTEASSALEEAGYQLA
jgi:copper chaperone CopZ